MISVYKRREAAPTLQCSERDEEVNMYCRALERRGRLTGTFFEADLRHTTTDFELEVRRNRPRHYSNIAPPSRVILL